MSESRTGNEPEHEQVAEGREVFAGAVDENRAVLRELSRALGRLPADQSEALLMVVVQGMSYEEVAKATGHPVTTVRGRVFRARLRLLDGFAVGLEDEASVKKGAGGQVPAAPEENAGERSAAEAMDRMIAALDAATATVQAQLAELRRMRRAA